MTNFDPWWPHGVLIILAWAAIYLAVGFPVSIAFVRHELRTGAYYRWGGDAVLTLLFWPIVIAGGIYTGVETFGAPLMRALYVPATVRKAQIERSPDAVGADHDLSGVRSGPA